MKKSERIADAENAIQNMFQHYHGMKAAIVGLLDEKPLQQLEHLTSNLHSLIQTVEEQPSRLGKLCAQAVDARANPIKEALDSYAHRTDNTLTCMSYDIQAARGKAVEATDMAKRAFDLCHDIQNKLEDQDFPATGEEIEVLKAQHRAMCWNHDHLRDTISSDIETNASHICDLNRQVADLQRELKSLDLLHKKDDEAQQAFNKFTEGQIQSLTQNMAILMVKLSGFDPAKVVKVTTDSPKPLPETPTNIAVYKLKIPNTADPSANLYWRREASGQLHLCELCSADRAHPCCEALDFPDPGRATKEQPKAYCGLCLQRFYNILCEGK